MATNVEVLANEMKNVEEKLSIKIDGITRAIDELRRHMEDTYVTKEEFAGWKVRSSMIFAGIGFVAVVFSGTILTFLFNQLIGIK